MKTINYILLIFSIWACSNQSPYPGFSKGKQNIYYQLHKIGEFSQKAKYNDYITADIVYKTMADSVFFEGRRKLQLTKTDAKGSVDKCFTMLSEGDCATFIISADEFFLKTLESDLPPFIKPGSNMKVKVDVVDIQTNEEYNKEKKAFLNWIEDFGEYEKVVLQQFLSEEKLPVQPTGTGLFYLVIEEGKGKKIEKGDTITVNYEGKFLHGKYFDSTIRRNQPFQFIYGTEWQVIKGLEEGIGLMREGEKALFILPSDLAFGTEGSSTGIIPPFTSLIFVVEILSVN
ncbi:MAG: FKBP-type peptidyl-prolyl cis-trans isomerase [Bacteroidales bacterium]|nr:FKBP-type peptidyl-prolyl cis-trans isomerase [Bacteroidales bacterium]